MKKLTLNPDYAKRHLFVVILMTGLCGWFGYDGFVRYPSLPAVELYRSIEKSDPPSAMDLEAFKRQKTQTQYGFTLLTFFAALIVGVRLYGSYRFSFEYDETGFAFAGKRHAWADIASVDRSLWDRKSILKLRLADGSQVVLDGWHHRGVKEVLSHLN